jgi:ABC-2 type transport system ATP-binding protein
VAPLLARGVGKRFGGVVALAGVDLDVRPGGVVGLVGPNGSGKTTLLQILMGLRKAKDGRVEVMGKDVNALTLHDRASMAYIAEGQPLPTWMRLEQLEAYLAPLYESWDSALATELREQFELDPARKIGAMSRGEQMKAALLVALAPRPKLLIMDEPFTGMDAIVKDELVRGLLQSSGSEGWTVLVCSHDISELELLADNVGLIDHGRLRLSATMDEVRSRFHYVDATLPSGVTIAPDTEWLSLERAGNRARFVVDDNTNRNLAGFLTTQLPPDTRIEIRGATLREVFIALARPQAKSSTEVAA